MGSNADTEAGAEQSTIPRLPLFSVPPMQSPERSGMLTPPLYASAAVPFRWEQKPGKPRPCTALVTFSNDISPKCLELPPRLLIDAKLTKLPSPTTVLEGPYLGSNRFRSPSFRMTNDCYGGSFSSAVTETKMPGAMVLAKGVGIKEKGWWFSSWRKKPLEFKVERDQVNGGSHVFPSSADRETDHDTGSGTFGVEGSHNKVKTSKLKRSGSFSCLSHGESRVWTTICEGLKQVVPWRSKKLKKDGSGLRL